MHYLRYQLYVWYDIMTYDYKLWKGYPKYYVVNMEVSKSGYSD